MQYLTGQANKRAINGETSKCRRKCLNQSGWSRILVNMPIVRHMPNCLLALAKFPFNGLACENASPFTDIHFPYRIRSHFLENRKPFSELFEIAQPCGQFRCNNVDPDSMIFLHVCAAHKQTTTTTWSFVLACLCVCVREVWLHRKKNKRKFHFNRYPTHAHTSDSDPTTQPLHKSGVRHICWHLVRAGSKTNTLLLYFFFVIVYDGRCRQKSLRQVERCRRAECRFQ